MDRDTQSQSPLERKLKREIAARKEAELLLESKSLELYKTNQQLELVLTQLKHQTRCDLDKLEFEQQINEALIHYGRAFLNRTLDDGMISSLLERLTSTNVVETSGLILEEGVISTIVGNEFGKVIRQDLSSRKPYSNWQKDTLHIPIEVDYKTVGELTVQVNDSDVDRDFVTSQIVLIGDLLCSAISRQIIVTQHQQARSRAEESERSTKEFVAMINHELRTPLNGLLGSAELLATTPLDDEQQVLLCNLTHSGDLLRHIINDILDFSKMSAGMMELIPSQFSWLDLSNMISGIFQPKALEKGIAFKIECAEDLPSAFIGDFERIGQILVNIVGNAIKFTSQGEVKLLAKWQQKRLCFSVIDSGVGISRELHEKLFTPFVQVDRSAKRNFEGTGLGLAICKNLVELMSGDISLTSELGKGSCFEVKIPLKIAPSHTVSTLGKGIGTSSKPLDNLSVLVVDDIRMNQVIMHQMLKKMSIRPDIVSNGIEAIKAVSASQYDIVFMDCRMPEMDGFEATQYLRQQQFTLPIIALTAGTTLEERERCIQSGMDDILTKPYTAMDLKLMLEKWI